MTGKHRKHGPIRTWCSVAVVMFKALVLGQE